MSKRSTSLTRLTSVLCTVLLACACTAAAKPGSDASPARATATSAERTLHNKAEKVTPSSPAPSAHASTSGPATNSKNSSISHAKPRATNRIQAVVPTTSQPVMAPEKRLPEHTPVPGGIALLTVGASSMPRPNVTLNDAPVYVTRRGNYWVAAIGIPLKTEAGELAVTVKTSGHPDTKLLFDVVDTQYKTQSLTIANKRKVNPNPDDQARIERDWIQIKKAKNTFNTSTLPDLKLEWPLKGRISSEFGLRRIYNGQPRSPHSGLDIAAPTGTPIIAPASGTVIEIGDFFFNGQTALVDHGHGLVTMYCHMSKVDVNVGDKLSTGDLIGLVGETGRVTGPHLHLGVLLNGQMVNPGLLLVSP